MTEPIAELQIVPINTSMPVMTIQEAVKRHEQMVEFVQKIMKEGKDFGTIPGTDTKPTLLKAGAEKLTTFFGLTPIFMDETVVEDFSNPDYPFFFYRRKCQLWRGDLMIAEASGSCNSREKKYRWRAANQTCPACGRETIIKGKAEFGGGWVCWTKKGGCGAKFPDNAPEITKQQMGQVENPDVYDLGNTILKMADKRALVATTLLAVNASEFFTQDLEDMVEGEIIDEGKKKARPVRQTRQPRSNNGKPSRWENFLADNGISEEKALKALSFSSVQDWMRANPGKTETDAYAEILQLLGKA